MQLLFLESDSESEDGNITKMEVCECVKEGCYAKVEIGTEELILVKGHTFHSCLPTLKMNIEFGMIDGYKFCKDQGFLIINSLLNTYVLNSRRWWRYIRLAL